MLVGGQLHSSAALPPGETAPGKKPNMSLDASHNLPGHPHKRKFCRSEWPVAYSLHSLSYLVSLIKLQVVGYLESQTIYCICIT